MLKVISSLFLFLSLCQAVNTLLAIYVIAGKTNLTLNTRWINRSR